MLILLIVVGLFDDVFENHMKEIGRLECYPTVYMSMYVTHSETTTIIPITATLVTAIDVVQLLWLLYIYLRILPKLGSAFASVQGCVLVMAASVALWVLQICVVIGLPARLCLISIDIFTDDICVYFMIMRSAASRSSDAKHWYFTFCGGCHRCIARMCFGGNGMSDDGDDRGYQPAISEKEQESVITTEESGSVSSDAHLL